MKMLKKSIVLILLMFLTSCAMPTPFMKKSESFLSPPEGKALVRFISPKAPAYLFDSDKFIAYMSPNTQFDYLTKPGKHLFIASQENKVFLEAELEAGKTYYVLLRVYTGVWRARVAFIAVNKGGQWWDKVYDYEKRARKLQPDTDAINAWESKNNHKTKAVIAEYDTVWKNKEQWESLRPEDGR